MQIRQANQQDAAVLAQMRWDFLTERYADNQSSNYPEFAVCFSAFFNRIVTDERWFMWIAEQDGQIASHIFVQMVEQVPNLADSHRYFGWITNVYTRPEYRNQGIGSALMRHVIAWAKTQPIESLNLWHSERSVPYYERLGFTPTPDELMLMLDE